MNDNCLLRLQTDTDIGSILPGPCSKICLLPSRYAKQLMTVTVEEVWNEQEEEVPVPITWQTIKAECGVSCMSVCFVLCLVKGLRQAVPFSQESIDCV
jgi:hypothetical protein